MARKYELNINIMVDDFESMVSALHIAFQDVAVGIFDASKYGAMVSCRLTLRGPMEELKQEYLSYRDAADEEAR